MCDPEEFNMYLANLEEYVFDEGKVVSLSWLSRTLDIHVALAKKLLSTFTSDESFKSKLSICWFLLGTGKEDPLSRKIKIVPSNQLDSCKKKFDNITSEHIYSIQKKGTSETDVNTVYLADQSVGKNMSQCSSLSNIKCDQVKIVPNRRSAVPTEISSRIGNPITSGKTAPKPADKTKKSPVKNAIGNMFTKKKEENEKKKQDTGDTNIKADKKIEKPTVGKEEILKKSPENKVSVSPVKKSSAGNSKKKAPENTGTKNITSFFSKGSLPEIKKNELVVKKNEPIVKKNEPIVKKNEPNVKKNEPVSKKTSTKTSKDSKKEKDEEPMVVDEIDENTEPVNQVENESNSKTKKTSTKSKPNSKKSDKKVEKKEKKIQKRRKIQVFSDSSESEANDSERDRSPSPPPPSPPRIDIKAALSDDDEVIPATPEPQSNGDRKRKRKLVSKTMTDESGFLRTVKEFETVSCSDSDGESSSVKQDTKKPKVESKPKDPPVQKPAVTNQKSPVKSKQTSILNFFKKSA